MALVESGACCGQHGSLRWTEVPVRWTACGRLKNHENSRRFLLCSAQGWLYNFSTSENGYHSEGTSGDLGETPGSLEGSQRTLERSVVRRQLWASWGASRAFRGNPGGPWSWFLGSRETGQPESRLVSWTGGRTNGVWFADCPSGSACRGNRWGISGPAWRGPCISYMRGPRHFIVGTRRSPCRSPNPVVRPNECRK